MEEIWKDIPGYEGKYQVSNFGRVRSLDRIDDENHFRKGQIMKTKLLRGYVRVALRDGKKQKDYQVHRLVALAFIPNPEGFKCVNHKDENKLNNNVDNLEWCTLAYNFNYGTARARQGISYGKPVEQLAVDGLVIASYCSAEVASKLTGMDSSSIHKCCRGKRQSAGGYCWRYKA